MRSFDFRLGTIRISRTWPRTPDSRNCCTQIPVPNSDRPIAASAKKSRSSSPATIMETRNADMTSAPQPAAQASGLRVVAIGGGTGLSTLLKGLKRYVLSVADAAVVAADSPVIRDLSAVVTVSD